MKLNIECPECKTKYKLEIKEVLSAEENRLKAAAPQLLEACKVILHSVNVNKLCEQINDDDAEHLSEAAAQIYKAITKAEA